MLNTIGLHFGWPYICKKVEDFVKTCDECQKHKITAKRTMIKFIQDCLNEHGHWAVIHVDCHNH